MGLRRLTCFGKQRTRAQTSLGQFRNSPYGTRQSRSPLVGRKCRPPLATRLPSSLLKTSIFSCSGPSFDRHISLRMTLFPLSTHHTLSLEVSTHGLNPRRAVVVVQHQGSLQGNASPAKSNDSYTWRQAGPPFTPLLGMSRRCHLATTSPAEDSEAEGGTRVVPRPAQQCQVSCGRIRRSR